MRTDPLPTSGELDSLTQYLDYQRATVLLKTDGLDREQLAQTLPPSSLTLGGLLNHLALVEDSWMDERFLGRPEAEPWASVDWVADPDWEFHTAAELEPEMLRQRYLDACDRSRAAVAGADGADQLSATALSTGESFTLRWVLLHLIEETARHIGHADLLRESIDGVVGE
ncbi:MAG: hypothetical protein RI885_1732 [Actinomycetota bacterium]|jgi:uncharacterized damage-inducible protein DinB